jgi:sulfite reductase beta subunit
MIPRTRSWRSGWGQPLERLPPAEFSDAGGSGGANNLPRWLEATAIVKGILKAYQQDAKNWQRINDWIDHIGWPRFFKLTN